MWMRILAVSTICALTYTMGHAAYWILFDNDPPFVSTRATTYDPNGLRETHFKAGETVLVERDFCAEQDVIVDYARLWRGYDSNIIFLGRSGEVAIKAGCVESKHAIVLSDLMPPGRYGYEGIVTYRNNPLHVGIMRLPVPVIEIVP